MKCIAGEHRTQSILFPDSLDNYVTQNNPVRVIDAYVDSLDLKQLEFTISTAQTGRPPYNPADILKIYIYGYLNKIRSSRRLEQETTRNLELMWLIKKLSPDHKTIAKFRHDNPKALKNTFKDFVKLCIKLDLYSKELIAIDGSKFKAVNSKANNFTKKKLDSLIARLDKKIDEINQEMDNIDKKETKQEENTKTTAKTEQETKEILNQHLTELYARKKVYQGYAEKLKQTKETQISLTDHDSRLMISNDKADVCYNIQTAVDAKNKLVAEFEVTNAINDLNLLSVITKKAAQTLEVPKLAATADKGYASATDIVSCVTKGFEVHVAGASLMFVFLVKKSKQKLCCLIRVGVVCILLSVIWCFVRWVRFCIHIVMIKRLRMEYFIILWRVKVVFVGVLKLSLSGFLLLCVRRRLVGCMMRGVCLLGGLG